MGRPPSHGRAAQPAASQLVRPNYLLGSHHRRTCIYTFNSPGWIKLMAFCFIYNVCSCVGAKYSYTQLPQIVPTGVVFQSLEIFKSRIRVIVYFGQSIQIYISVSAPNTFKIKYLSMCFLRHILNFALS